MSASCSSEPDPHKSALLGRLSARSSGPRLSWARAVIGSCNSVIVQERAILRLVEAGISITQTGYSGQDATDDIVADAAAKIAAVVEGTGKEDKVALHHLRNGTPTDAIALTVAELGVPPRGRPCRLGGLTRGRVHP